MFLLIAELDIRRVLSTEVIFQNKQKMESNYGLLRSQVVLGAIVQSCNLDESVGSNPCKTGGYLSWVTLHLNFLVGLCLINIDYTLLLWGHNGLMENMLALHPGGWQFKSWLSQVQIFLFSALGNNQEQVNIPFD